MNSTFHIEENYKFPPRQAITNATQSRELNFLNDIPTIFSNTGVFAATENVKNVVKFYQYLELEEVQKADHVFKSIILQVTFTGFKFDFRLKQPKVWHDLIRQMGENSQWSVNRNLEKRNRKTRTGSRNWERNKNDERWSKGHGVRSKKGSSLAVFYSRQ